MPKNRKHRLKDDDFHVETEHSNLSKFRKPDNLDRPGRVYRKEKKYRNGSDHTGKKTTLADKRRGKY
jgi:hypothetical protein